MKIPRFKSLEIYNYFSDAAIVLAKMVNLYEKNLQKTLEFISLSFQ